jgi:hypothetical protein
MSPDASSQRRAVSMEELRIEHAPGRFVARLGAAEAVLVYERRGDP